MTLVGSWARVGDTTDPRNDKALIYKWPDGKKSALCSRCYNRMLSAGMRPLKLTRDKIDARCQYAGWDHE